MLCLVCCDCLDSPHPSSLAVKQKLGPPEVLLDGLEEAGRSLLREVGTILCRPALWAGPLVVVQGLFAVEGSEYHCVPATKHEFDAAF